MGAPLTKWRSAYAYYKQNHTKGIHVILPQIHWNLIKLDQESVQNQYATRNLKGDIGFNANHIF